jgi:hypothetical protein
MWRTAALISRQQPRHDGIRFALAFSSIAIAKIAVIENPQLGRMKRLANY